MAEIYLAEAETEAKGKAKSGTGAGDEARHFKIYISPSGKNRFKLRVSLDVDLLVDSKMLFEFHNGL